MVALAFLNPLFAAKLKEGARDKEDKLHELFGLSGSSDKNLGIKKPTRELWRQALEQAIEDFWALPRGEEGRFLEFLLASRWHKEFEATEKLKRCPIPVQREGRHEFAEAGKSYFPATWGGNELLEQLWGDNPCIPWPSPFLDRTQINNWRFFVGYE